MLSHLLATQKVESTVVEIRRRREIQETVRAGILEHGTVNMLVGSGVSDRVPREGHRRDGIVLRFKGESHRIDFKQLVGESVWLYPQTDVFRDLAARREADGGDVRYGVSETTVDASRGSQWSGSPTRTAGTRSRPTSWSEPTAPAASAASRSRRPTHVGLHEYPFAWFGILAEAPRSLDVLIYANSEHGFALVSQRTETVRRMYFQCDPKKMSPTGTTRGSGPSSASACLNLAIHDIHALFEGLDPFYSTGSTTLLDSYSGRALGTRVESPALLLLDDLHAAHRPGLRRLRARPPARRADTVVSSRHAQAHLAEAYTGWPAST
jgi:p-hydroxybenzoate 3-monooxygenase